MALYRNIHCAFWEDAFFMSLTPEEKYFYLYLLTNPKTSQCGIYELPYQVAEFQTGYNRDTVVKLIQRFVDYGKIKYHEPTKEVYLINWIKFNWNSSPKVVKFIQKEIQNVKYTPFVRAFLTTCADLGYRIDTVSQQYANSIDTPSTDAGYGIDTVGEPYRKEVEVEVKEKEITTTPTTGAVRDEGFELWNSCLAELEKIVSKPSFETWIKNTTFDSFHANTLIISTPNDFSRDWLESRYSSFIKDTLFKIRGSEVAVKFIVPQSAAS